METVTEVGKVLGVRIVDAKLRVHQTGELFHDELARSWIFRISRPIHHHERSNAIVPNQKINGQHAAMRGDLTLLDRAGDQNGGGTINGGDAGSRNGYRDGYTTGYGNGSRSDYGLDSCVEVRHELTNPYVLTVPPPASEAQAREIEKDERLWRDRCRPVIKQDRYGVNRYVYAAPGCEFGKYE